MTRVVARTRLVQCVIWPYSELETVLYASVLLHRPVVAVETIKCSVGKRVNKLLRHFSVHIYSLISLFTYSSPASMHFEQTQTQPQTASTTNDSEDDIDSGGGGGDDDDQRHNYSYYFIIHCIHGAGVRCTLTWAVHNRFSCALPKMVLQKNISSAHARDACVWCLTRHKEKERVKQTEANKILFLVAHTPSSTFALRCEWYDFVPIYMPYIFILILRRFKWKKEDEEKTATATRATIKIFVSESKSREDRRHEKKNTIRNMLN